jgi:hypothetical protein
MGGLVMETHQLLRFQRDHRIRFAVVIAELDFVDTRSPVLDNRANLAAD